MFLLFPTITKKKIPTKYAQKEMRRESKHITKKSSKHKER